MLGQVATNCEAPQEWKLSPKQATLSLHQSKSHNRSQVEYCVKFVFLGIPKTLSIEWVVEINKETIA